MPNGGTDCVNRMVSCFVTAINMLYTLQEYLLPKSIWSVQLHYDFQASLEVSSVLCPLPVRNVTILSTEGT
jgi:hypothetical protein